MLDPELLKLLCCPETHQDLFPAETILLEQINQQITAGTLKNRGQQTVVEKIDGGLVRADRKLLFPVRNNIPVMLLDEAIPLP